MSAEERSNESVGADSAGYDQRIAALTAPGQPFEVIREDVLGHELPVYRNALPNLRAVFETMAQYGDTPFLVYGDTRWSFAEHDLRVRRLASYLSAHGVAKGDRVAIGMRNYPEWVISFWALQAMGAIAVPLNAWWTGAELQFAIEDSGADVALLDDERVERLQSVDACNFRLTLVARARRHLPDGVVAFESVIEDGSSDATLPDVEIAPDDPATIMYTSGTTGRPKGAVQTHRNHCTNLMNMALGGAMAALAAADAAPAPADAGPPPPPSALQTFPFFHIGGLSGLYACSAFGSKLVMMYKWNPSEAVDLFLAEQITAVSGVPTVVRELFDELDRRQVVAEQLGAVSSGGAPVPPSLITRMGDRSGRQIRPANGYGLTETTSAVVSNSGMEYYDHPDSVGRPVPVAEVTIRDEDGNVLPDGATGELWVRGPNVVNGYWMNEEATAAAFTDGWFHTGDAAYVRDGYVYVVDRLKDVVLRGGENVYCAEVEAAIHALDGIADVAVVGLPHDVLGEEVAAVVRLAPGSELTGAEMRRRLAVTLAAFKVPSKIFVAGDELPRTGTGKLLKRDIRTQLAQGVADYVTLD